VKRMAPIILSFVVIAASVTSAYTGASALTDVEPVSGENTVTSNAPAYTLGQTISDGAQRTTLAFAGLAIMTYAGDLFSWYADSVDADVYFCPERHGIYYLFSTGFATPPPAPALTSPDDTDIVAPQ